MVDSSRHQNFKMWLNANEQTKCNLVCWIQLNLISSILREIRKNQFCNSIFCVFVCERRHVQSEKIGDKKRFVFIWKYEIINWMQASERTSDRDRERESEEEMNWFDSNEKTLHQYCALNIFIGHTDGPDLFPLLLKQNGDQ